MRGSSILSIGLLSVLIPCAFGASELNIELTPRLTLTGSSGSYQIQRANVVGAVTNWIAVTNLYLSDTPYVLYDDAVVGTGQQFYRAVALTPDQINPFPQRLVWIPPGTFKMGSPETEREWWSNEGPQTSVSITKGFFMQKYEMTQIEYETLMGTNRSVDVGPYLPVQRVSWDDAVAFCGVLTAFEKAIGRLPAGYKYRLPTEAEWEYACRAGTTTRFSYGDDPDYDELGEYAWISANSAGRIHAVGQKRPNAWGLCDMHGNIWEWCLDWYADSLPGGIVTDPRGPNSGSSRVVRGGGYTNSDWDFRSARRAGDLPDHREHNYGFRVVLAPDP